jgi:hypothetical protein
MSAAVPCTMSEPCLDMCLDIAELGSGRDTHLHEKQANMTIKVKDRCSACSKRVKLSFRGLCPPCGLKRKRQGVAVSARAGKCCRSCNRPAGKRGSFAALSKRGYCPDCCRKLREQRRLPEVKDVPKCAVCQREPCKKNGFTDISNRGLCPDCSTSRARSRASELPVKHCIQCKRKPGKTVASLSRRGLCADCGKMRQKLAGLAGNQSKAGSSSGIKRSCRSVQSRRAIKRLKSHTAEQQRPKPAAEMFSGSGRLSLTLRKLGWTSEEWDLRHGIHMDMTQKACQQDFFAKMRAGLFLFIWFGTCCKTFSRATGAGPGPQPVRSNEHVWGFPDLTGVRKEKTMLANKLAKFTLKAIFLANRLKLHWAVENPLTSMLWMLPGFLSLKANKHQNVFVRVDYCQFGTSWQKPTAILSNCKALSAVGATCHMTLCKSSGTRRICSRSGKCHHRLAGLDDEGVWHTSHAEPYPVKLCRLIASTLDKAL